MVSLHMVKDEEVETSPSISEAPLESQQSLVETEEIDVPSEEMVSVLESEAPSVPMTEEKPSTIEAR